MNYEITIIIPARNEEKIIGKTLDYYIPFLSERIKNIKFLVVMDNCNDKTLEIVKEYKKKYKNLDYIYFENSLGGKGGAIIEGFKYSINSDIIGFVDADAPIDAKDLYNMIKIAEKYDCVIGTRKYSSYNSIFRMILSFSFRVLINILFFINIYDVQTGAKIFKGNVIRKILNNLTFKDFTFDTELLYLIKKEKFEIFQYPLKYYKYEKKKTRNMLKMTISMFKSIIKMRIKYL